VAFGITRLQVEQWKEAVTRGEIAYLTHYWYEPRFPECKTITKVGCSDLERLVEWCYTHELNPAYIHRRDRYPHFDLIGRRQLEILVKEGFETHIERFGIRYS
jgi:hypothetical protein